MPPNICEPGIKVIVKMGVRPGGGGLVGSKVGGSGWSGKCKKWRIRLEGGGVRVDVIEELKGAPVRGGSVWL